MPFKIWPDGEALDLDRNLVVSGFGSHVTLQTLRKLLPTFLKARLVLSS